MERALIRNTRPTWPRCCPNATGTRDAVIALAELPLQIKGFGPVKQANAAKAEKRREELLAAIRAGGRKWRRRRSSGINSTRRQSDRHETVTGNKAKASRNLQGPSARERSDRCSQPAISPATILRPFRPDPGGRAMIRTMENLTGRIALIKRAAGYEREVAMGRDFWQVIVERYGLSLDVVGGSLDSIPREGPLVLIANHPYGILDGLMMGHILSRTRGDFRILAHQVFGKAPDLERVILPISFDGSRRRWR